MAAAINLKIWSWKEVIRSSTWVSIGMRPTLIAKKVEFIRWLIAQSDLSMQNQDFPTWLDRYYTMLDGSVHVRSSLVVFIVPQTCFQVGFQTQGEQGQGNKPDVNAAQLPSSQPRLM